MRRLEYFSCCVAWNPEDVHCEGGLCDMIRGAKNITRKTFLRHVDKGDRESLEGSLGYAPHDPEAVLTMAKDWHVSYHKSKLHGKTVYFFKHSAIEYVFR